MAPSGSYHAPGNTPGLFNPAYAGIQGNTQLAFDQRAPSPFQQAGMNQPGVTYGAGQGMGYNTTGYGQYPQQQQGYGGNQFGMGQAYPTAGQPQMYPSHGGDHAGAGTYPGGYGYQNTDPPQMAHYGQAPQPDGLVPPPRQSSPYGQPYSHGYQAQPMQPSGSSSGYSAGQRRAHTPARGQPGRQHPPPRHSQQQGTRQPPTRPSPAVAAQTAPRGPSGPSAQAPFREDDFPSLGSQPSGQRSSGPPSRRRQDAASQLSQQFGAASLDDQPSARGGRRKFVPFTDYSVSLPAPDSPEERALPSPRRRRNQAFCLDIDSCYRGKVIFIDKLEGIDYSDHPAVVRSVDKIRRKITFFKQSSFKKIGGFYNKYGMYVNKNQKRWHEKQWLLVDDGVTKPHDDTPMLRLADGERMSEMGSYLDIHGNTELHIDYFSKYSRAMQFPEIFFPADQMDLLERYSEWYLKEDEKHRREMERKREMSQTDGAADEDEDEDDFCPEFSW